ncbi:MAG: RNA polymerase sigma factor [Bacteroidota bacterium]
MEIPREIIKGCLKGKKQSQEKLYRLTSPLMYGLCLQYAGNEDDAKDIMQEGFIKVFNKMDQFSEKGSIMGWIRRIMINTALEKYRSQVSRQSLDNGKIQAEEIVEDYTLENLEADVIVELIQQLTPQYRLIFNLYAIEGYSHREISEMTGISEGTSKSNLSRARRILQRKVMELYEKNIKPNG